MNNELNDQEKRDRHLLNRADAAERAEMKTRLAEDAEMRALLEADTDIAATVEAAGDAKLKDRLRKLESELSAGNTGAKIRSLPGAGARPQAASRTKWYAMAAALALLLVAGWFVLRPAAAPDYLAYLDAYPNRAVELTKGADDGSDPAVAAYSTYEAADYESAATLLARLPETPTNRFYRAQSLLQLRQPAEAAALLQPLAGDESFALQDRARWYYALALLGSDRADEAKAQLRVSAATEGGFMQAEAEELLEAL